MSAYSIGTIYGKRFDFSAPTPSMIRIEDIAHALAMSCRFNGHLREFYSVAQHSALGTNFMRDLTLKKAFLLHDAGEAYLSDIVRPCKNLLGGNVEEVERNILNAVALRFGLDPNVFDHPAVKEMDNRMLVTERDQLQPNWPRELWGWADVYEPLPITIQPLAPFDAKALFLMEFRELWPSERINL